MQKVSQDELFELHSVVTHKLIEIVNDDNCSHQDISNAIKFLSANGVTVDLKSNGTKKDKVTRIPRLDPEHLKLA